MAKPNKNNDFESLEKDLMKKDDKKKKKMKVSGASVKRLVRIIKNK
jgi:hypothetical protein